MEESKPNGAPANRNGYFLSFRSHQAGWAARRRATLRDWRPLNFKSAVWPQHFRSYRRSPSREPAKDPADSVEHPEDRQRFWSIGVQAAIGRIEEFTMNAHFHFVFSCFRRQKIAWFRFKRWLLCIINHRLLWVRKSNSKSILLINIVNLTNFSNSIWKHQDEPKIKQI